MLCSRREHIEKGWTRTAQEKPLSHGSASCTAYTVTLFCCNILPPWRGRLWQFISHCLSHYLFKASSLQEKSGHKSLLQVTTKALYRGYTNYDPHVVPPTCGSFPSFRDIPASSATSFPSWINCHGSIFKPVHSIMITTKYIRGIPANNCPANKLVNCFAWQLSQVTSRRPGLRTTKQMGTVPRPDFCRSILTNQPAALQLLLPTLRIISHSSNFLAMCYSTVQDSLFLPPVNIALGSHGLVSTK